MQMNELPPCAIHRYILQYGLLANETRPLTYLEAVLPRPPPSCVSIPPRRLDVPDDSLLRGPAIDGQELDEADGRLTDIVQQHWERQVVRDSQTIVDFMHAIRLKGTLPLWPRSGVSSFDDRQGPEAGSRTRPASSAMNFRLDL
jgi:hypothetical protein